MRAHRHAAEETVAGSCSSMHIGEGDSHLDYHTRRASGKGRGRSCRERDMQTQIARLIAAPNANARGLATDTRELTRGMCSVVCQCVALMLVLVPTGYAWTLAELTEGKARCHERVSAYSCDEEQGQVCVHNTCVFV